MSYERLAERLATGKTIILDGATGTEIERRGAPMAGVGWSMLANAEAPDIVRQIHEDYIEARADVIIANTFSGQRHRLERAGLADRLAELNRRGVELALEARENAHPNRDIAVAGSIAPPSAWESASFSSVVDAYAEQAALLAEAGVEFMALEMLQDVSHATMVIEAAKATGLPVWAGFSCKLEEDGRTVSLLSSPPGESFADSLDALGPLGVDAVSIMHTEVEVVGPALEVLAARWAGPTGAYPHAGSTHEHVWTYDESYTPERLLEATIGWREQGATILGTCCGMGPDHIRILTANFAD